MSWTLCVLGAAGTVTGSKFLLESEGHRILVDAGLYQGEREWRRRNWDLFPIATASIEAVVVTRAHLLHERLGWTTVVPRFEELVGL